MVESHYESRNEGRDKDEIEETKNTEKDFRHFFHCDRRWDRPLEEHRYRYHVDATTLLVDERKEKKKKVCATILSSSDGEGVRMRITSVAEIPDVAVFRKREQYGRGLLNALLCLDVAELSRDVRSARVYIIQRYDGYDLLHYEVLLRKRIHTLTRLTNHYCCKF